MYVAINMCIIYITSDVVFVMAITAVCLFNTGSPRSRALVIGIVVGTLAPFVIIAIICTIVFLYIYCKKRRDNRRINERLQEYRRERARANNNVRETAEMTVSDACIIYCTSTQSEKHTGISIIIILMTILTAAFSILPILILIIMMLL